jgi:hypothetical protein
VEMRDWREFISGEVYRVHLRDNDSGEEVSVWMSDTPDDLPILIVENHSRSLLFDRALGRVIQAWSEHSDNLMVDRRTIAKSGRRGDCPPGSHTT